MHHETPVHGSVILFTSLIVFPLYEEMAPSSIFLGDLQSVSAKPDAAD